MSAWRAADLDPFLEALRDAALVVDAATGRFVRWNSASVRLFGYSAAEAVGQPTELLGLASGHLSPRWPPPLEGRPVVPDDTPFELRARHRNGEEIAIEVTLSPLADETSTDRLILAILRDVTRRVYEQRRQEAVLRAARRLTAESNPTRVLHDVLAEAVAVVEADAGAVYQWDEVRSALIPADRTHPLSGDTILIALDFDVATRAATERRPIVRNGPALEADSSTRSEPPIHSALAVPLLYEGRLLGVLEVGSLRPQHQFTAADSEVLELLASFAAAILIGLAQSRLEGVLLAARTADHELRNKLAVTKGYAELLAVDRTLSDRARDFAEQAAWGVDRATEILDRFQHISQLQETDWGTGTETTIDLDRSTA
ncbi:MAG: GAF domain-containing protein [Chloroflexi bacterium]|nr:GAF domain-containing protein [Chloroflexota bacterium]